MQAITTKYLGPTNYRGTRVKAMAQAGSTTLCWDYALNADENHVAAAKALAEKWGWSGDWISGTSAVGTHVHVRAAHYPGRSFSVAEKQS